MCLFAPRRLETCPKVGIECVDCERWRRISGSVQEATVRERRGQTDVTKTVIATAVTVHTKDALDNKAVK
jgi:hypothetical protein